MYEAYAVNYFKFKEMEGVRLLELQRHGEEVQELKRSKSELMAVQMQLEQKVAQKDTEVLRLQKRCQDLVKAVKIKKQRIGVK